MTKVCKRCQQDLPLDAFSRQAAGYLGRRSRCKKCIAVEAAAYRARTVEKRKAYNDRYRAEHLEERRAYNRAWIASHPEQALEASRRYRLRHFGESRPRYCSRERQNEISNEWKKRNREKVAAQKRAWRLANPDKVAAHKRAHYERHQEKIKARVASWRTENRDRVLASHRKRRATQAAAAGASYTTATHIAARVALYGSRCVYCGGCYESVDHRIPLTRGGSHWPANLLPSCKSCNSRKNNKTEREFRAVLTREGVTAAP